MSDLLVYPPPDYGATMRQTWLNTYIKNDAGSLIQVRGKGRSAPRWQVGLAWDRNVGPGPFAAGMAAFSTVLRKFKAGMGGCYFYTPSPWDWWDDAAAGTGDATTLVFPFGGSQVDLLTVPPTVTVGGAAKTRGTDFEVGIGNELLRSEDLTNTSAWVAQSGASVTRTAGRTDPLGGSTAHRIEIAGGTTPLKLLGAFSGGSAATGTPVYIDIWVKNNSGTNMVEIACSPGASSGILLRSAPWTHIQAPGATATSGTPSMTFSQMDPGGTLDFDVWHPFGVRYNAVHGTPGPTWGYIPTVAAGIAPDTTLGKWNLTFYPSHAPGVAAANLISFRGRRLLLGAMSEDPGEVSVPGYGRTSFGIQLEGEEV